MSSASSLERPVAAGVGVGVAIAGIAGVGVASAGKDSGAATLFSGTTEPSSFTSIERPGVSEDIVSALGFRVVRISSIKLGGVVFGSKDVGTRLPGQGDAQ